MKNILKLLFCLISTLTFGQNPPSVEWEKFIRGSKKDIVNQVIPSTDGGYYIIGNSESTDLDYSFMNSKSEANIIKLNSEGAVLWKRQIFTKKTLNFGSGICYSAIEDNDGLVIVGNSEEGLTLGQNINIVKLDKTNGNIIWERSLDLPNAVQREVWGIDKSKDNYFVAGQSSRNYYDRGTIIQKLSKDGTEITRKTVPNFYQNYNYFYYHKIYQNLIQITNDNSIILAGVQNNDTRKGCWFGEGYDKNEVRVIKLDLNLNIIWDKTFTGNTSDEVRDMVITPNNEIILLGQSCGEENENKGPFNINSYKWLLKLNSSGNFVAIEKLVENINFSNGRTYYGLGLSCDNKLLLSGQYWSTSITGPFISKLELNMKTELWFSNLDVFLGFYPALDVTVDKANNIITWGIEQSPEGGIYVHKLSSECGQSGKCKDATPIQCGQTIKSSTVGASSKFEIQDYSCLNSSSNYSGGDKVYSIDISNGIGNLDISLISSANLDIFMLNKCDATGVNCFAKSTYPVRSNGSGNAELIRFTKNLPNGTYYLVVDGASSSDVGAFELTVTCGQLDCLNARTLTCNQPVSESNSNGVNNSSSYCRIQNTAGSLNGFAGRGKEKIYQFIIEQEQTIKVDLTGMSAGSDFDLYILSQCDPDKCLGSSFNIGTTNESVNIKVVPGIYYAVVESYYDLVGSYTIKVTCNTGAGNIPRPRIVMQNISNAEQGQELKYPILANNFKNMTSLEFSLKVDNPSILDILRIEAGEIDPAYNLVTPSNIGISWIPNQQKELTISDGKVLFNLVLGIKANSGSTDISVTNTPTVPSSTVLVNGVPTHSTVDITKGTITVNQNAIQVCGKIRRIDDNPIPDVTLKLTGSKSDQINAGDQANYCFPSLTKNSSYTVTPEKGGNLRNGVNGRDLYLIQRNILGEKLKSPYLIIAADYDGNNFVNGRDLYLTQRLILGDTTIPPIKSWRFIAGDQVFSDPTNPFNSTIKESISLTNLTQSRTDIEFTGIKVCDVDNTAGLSESNLKSRTKSPVQIKLIENYPETDSIINMSISLADFRNITSMDYTLQWDPELTSLINYEILEPNPLKLNSGNIEIKRDLGQLLFTWYDNLDGKNLSDDTRIINLAFRISQNNEGKEFKITFSDSPLATTAYDKYEELRVNTHSAKVQTHKYQVNNNKPVLYPNPANSELFIILPLNNSSDYSAKILNSSGDFIQVPMDKYSPTILRLNIQSLSPGIFYIHLTSPTTNYFSKFIKM